MRADDLGQTKYLNAKACEDEANLRGGSQKRDG